MWTVLMMGFPPIRRKELRSEITVEGKNVNEDCIDDGSSIYQEDDWTIRLSSDNIFDGIYSTTEMNYGLQQSAVDGNSSCGLYC